MPYVSGAYGSDLAALQPKSRVQSVFDPRISVTSYRPSVDRHEMNDTDFEEDVSDFDEYEGRRSEDSYGKRSATTLSSFDELRTPDMQSNGFGAFDFQLEDGVAAEKAVEGPVGPHLFRLAHESSREVDVYLSMSPPQSPENVKAGPTLTAAPAARQAPPPVEDAPPATSIPLRTWTPRQVAEWMYSTGFDRTIVDTFFINDISGVTLIDLQYEDLKELGITSFGQRHRLWTEIRALKDDKLPGPGEELCFSPTNPPPRESYVEKPRNCSTPASPEDEIVSPTSGGRRRRHRHGSDDVISPAESASIVAIEQLLPKPHKCSKGENCSKWQKQQRKLAKIATEFPIEMAQIVNAKNSNSPVESGVGSTSIVVPSIVASSDILGPTRPAIRLEEGNLRVVQSRDPQENVRHFLDFQHVNTGSKADDPSTPPYEMFPPLSPHHPQAPHTNLRTLPKLTIPIAPALDSNTFSPGRTARPHGTPLTALDANQRAMVHDMWRVGSPASEMDVPVTAIPAGPIEREVSSSVPPDMRFGGNGNTLCSPSRTGRRGPPPASFYNFAPPPTQHQSIKRSSSSASGRNHRRRPSSNVPSVHTLAEEHETTDSASTVIEEAAADDDGDDDGQVTPTSSSQPLQNELSATAAAGYNHAGWMKKRKTKLLRHEWQEAHFRLRGTQLAMHKSDNIASLDDSALEFIDVDDYAVAICANNSKLNSAFKRLHLNAKKKEGDGAATFAFQLTPAAKAAGTDEEARRKKDFAHAATGKTHHFAVTTATERIDWMRELMLARARRQKDVGITSFE